MLKNNKIAGSCLALTIFALSNQSVHAFEFKAGDTDVNISGYVKLDAIYDVDADIGDFAILPRVGLDGSNVAEGHSNLHARQSRIRLSTRTPTSDDTLVTVFEWDMYGGESNSPQPRLRHAYGSWNGVLAGQTWTNFISDRALGQMRKVNFLPEPGANPGRQAQLRYTAGAFSVALEDPLNVGRGVVSGPSGLPAKAGLPDVTARYQSKVGSLNYAVAGLVRELSVDNGTVDDSATGWGVNLEGALAVGTNVTLRGTVKYGDGIGGYIESSPGATGAYVDPANNSLELIEQFGASASVAVKAGPGAVNIGHAFASADMDDAVSAGAVQANIANEKYQSTHVNYIWSPTSRVTYGVEVGYHTRKVQSGLDGSATRLQAMVQFGF